MNAPLYWMQESRNSLLIFIDEQSFHSISLRDIASRIHNELFDWELILTIVNAAEVILFNCFFHVGPNPLDFVFVLQEKRIIQRC